MLTQGEGPAQSPWICPWSWALSTAGILAGRCVSGLTLNPHSLCLSHSNTWLCPRWSQNSEEGKTGSYIPSIPPSSMEPGNSSLITNTGDGMPSSSAFLCQQPPPFSCDCHFTVIPGKCLFIRQSVANS